LTIATDMRKMNVYEKMMYFMKDDGLDCNKWRRP